MSDAPDNAVPTAVIASALEFAVKVARAGTAQRPALPVPAPLTTLTRRATLDPAAREKVRRVLDADEAFRARVAAAASPELLDEPGLLYLQRPDGWQQALAGMAPEPPETARELRRREAAERKLADAVRERDELAQKLDRAQAEARSANDALAAATDEIAALRRQLGEAQRALAKRSKATASAPASDPDAALLDALRAERDAAVAARDQALADRAAHDEVDLEHLRRLLAEATAVAGRPRTQPSGRKPIAVPGRSRTTPAHAAEFVLRTPGVLVLVDGYNLAKQTWPSVSLIEQRDRCIEATESLARRWGTEIQVVFDGADVPGAHTRQRRLVAVRYSPEGVSADDVLRDIVRGTPTDRPVAVVTDDRAIIRDITSMGANPVATSAFGALLV